MKEKVHISGAAVALAVFGGAFFVALAWFSDETTRAGLGAVVLNLLGVSGGAKVPVFIPVVLLAALIGAITIAKSREKALAEQLQASEEDRALSVTATQDGMWFHDLRTGEETFTPRWMEILGYSKADIRNGYATSEIHPDDVERAQQTLRAHLNSKTPYDLEMRLLHKQGYYVWVRSKGQAVWDAAGNPTRMAASISEITDRMRAEDALRQSQGQFRAITENSPSPLYLMDTESKILMVNGAYRNFYGISDDQALSMPISEWLGGCNAELLHEADQKVLKLGKPLELEFEVDLYDGTRRLMQSFKFPIFDSDNNVIGIGGIENDVTERKQAEKNLMAAMHTAEGANRAKSEFVANMSHELRTPLNAIIGFSEIMANEYLGPVGSPKYLEYAKDINSSGMHLLEIINNLLDLSKVEAGKFELQDDTINVPAALQACVTLVSGQARENGVHIQCDIPDGLPELRADERTLKQIVLNLLSNAIKFTPEDGTVTVVTWCRSDNTGFVICVSDTGMGIAEEDIDMVLTPFGQVESAHSRSQQGTGLGLPLTKSFVELHGGSFDIRSRVGVGTKVTIRFPVERIVPKRLFEAPQTGDEGPAARAGEGDARPSRQPNEQRAAS